MKKFCVGDAVRVVDQGGTLYGFVGQIVKVGLFRVHVRFCSSGKKYVFAFKREEIEVTHKANSLCKIGYGEKIMCLDLHLRERRFYLRTLVGADDVRSVDAGLVVHTDNMIQFLRSMNGVAVLRNKWVIG